MYRESTAGVARCVRLPICSTRVPACASGHHEFWPDAVSFRDETLFDPSMIVSHRQLTDVCLLGLATRMGGTLATFDGSIPLKAVKGATTRGLSIIAPMGR